MKLPITLACLAMLLIAACQPIVDHRDPAIAAMTRTALSVLPLPPLPGRIRFTVRITPTPVPDWQYVVTPTPKASE